MHRQEAGLQLAKAFETPNAYFYAVEKAKAAEKVFEKLEVGGKIETDQEKIRSEIFKFYQHLYTPDTETCQEERNFFLNHTFTFPAEQEWNLTCQITTNEVKGVIDNTKNGKSPGIDGLPYEFYKEFREELAGELADIFNQSLAKGGLSESQRTAVISLIPKRET